LNHRRVAVAGLCAAASLALGACASKTATTGPSGTSGPPDPAGSPAVALTNAVAALRDTGYDVSVSQGSTGASLATTGVGSADPKASTASLEIKGRSHGGDIDIAAIQVGGDLWTKIDAGPLDARDGIDPTKWLLLDPAKLTAPNSRPFDMSGSDDIFGVSGLLRSVDDLRRVDGTHVAGTVDLTASTGVAAPSPTDLAKAGAEAKKTPFRVALDGQGRLAEVDINADGFDKDLSRTISFSDFGSPASVTAPAAADVAPAPAAVYDLFNAG
jgi:hypothetical protein